MKTFHKMPFACGCCKHHSLLQWQLQMWPQLPLHHKEGQRLVLIKRFQELQQLATAKGYRIYKICKSAVHYMPIHFSICVCASVMCDTLAARHLTASFFSAAPSQAALAAPWLGGQSAVCLQAAFSCLSAPEQNWKGTKWLHVWEPETVKSEVDEAKARTAALSHFTKNTSHTIKSVISKVARAQILRNNANDEQSDQ